MGLSFPNQKHSVYISVRCASNMMIRFYFYMDHLFQLLRNLNSLAFYLIENSYLKAKCLKALNLLKVLSHTSWGADRTTLLKLYRSLVRSKLDYGCIIYGSARKSYLQMLDPIHNEGLRLALGAFRTSPVASLYVEADEPSLYSRREKLSLQYAIRLAANPSNPAHEVTFPPNYVDLYEQKPKAIKSFGIRISPLLESAPQNIEKHFTPNIPAWCMILIYILGKNLNQIHTY